MGKHNKKHASAEAAGACAMTAAMLAVNPVATKAWLDVMSESAGFVAHRLQQDMDTQTSMLACKNPADLLQIQSEFFKTAMEQYTEEATRLYKMMSDAGEGTIGVARSALSRSYDDVPL